jgi:hypothetical protein
VRQDEIHATKMRKMASNRGGQIELQRWRFRLQAISKDFARFRLHGSAVMSGLHPKAGD